MKNLRLLTLLLAVGTTHVACSDDTGDTTLRDAGADLTVADTGTTDSGTLDAGTSDTGTSDAGASDLDTDMADAGNGDAGMLPEEDDTVHTQLALNLDDATGVARITVRDNGDGITWFHVPSAATTVERVDGTVLTLMVDPENAQYIGVPLSEPTETLTFRYSFDDDLPAHGWDVDLGFSIIWPNYCGALFPCDNHPEDGTTFAVDVTYSGERELIYPQSITAEAPPYMFGIALSDLQKEMLGMTTAGTRVVSWIPNDASAGVRTATADLVAHFDFYERTYGEYIYGDEVGSVFVPNNEVGIGGMEHHPYWHIVEGAFTDASIHAHEAAHGWYGNGVRIRCWEDFVLSEGVASYMTARAMGATGGVAAQEAVFQGYSDQIDRFVAAVGDGVAWINNTCDPTVQFDESPLWSPLPYDKGALFLRAAAERTSYEAVDSALASFYAANKETAQGMQDLIDHLQSELAIDLDAEVQGWLLTPGRPDR